MKIKTSELSGVALDWAVAKCEGLTLEGEKTSRVYAWVKDVLTGDDEALVIYNPSRDWAHAGPIIEREEISIEFNRAEYLSPWIAYKLGLPDEDNPQGGPTPLIAAMRCFVASKMGEEVEIPPELLP
jgi:hypothetical protein